MNSTNDLKNWKYKDGNMYTIEEITELYKDDSDEEDNSEGEFEIEIKTMDGTKWDNDREKIVQYYAKLDQCMALQKDIIGLSKDLKKEMGINKTSDLKQYMKDYYQKVGKSKDRPRFVCDICQCDVAYHSKNLHLLSKKHVSNLAKNCQ